MQIVIPMSGFGERFRRAGYKVPKPLIEVEGKPIIAHVVDLFPGDHDFIFVCNEDHLRNDSWNMKGILESLSENTSVIAIAPHKLGPVNAIMEASSAIDLNQPTVVNYADFFCLWDFNAFVEDIRGRNLSGSVPAYRGFHPHSGGKTNYAYIREEDNLLQDIQEKKPFTENKVEEFASSGTYYFDSAGLMLNLFEEQIAKNLTVNGEFYVSSSMGLMSQRGLPVGVFELSHFMQWGTPEDLAEYNTHSTTFRQLVDHSSEELAIAGTGAGLILASGLGKRFSDNAYTVPKPFLPFCGSPLISQVAKALDRDSFIALSVGDKASEMAARKAGFENVYELPHQTSGQAESATLLADKFESRLTRVFTILPCDTLFGDSTNRLLEMSSSEEEFLIAWVRRPDQHAWNNPQSFSWIWGEGQQLACSFKAAPGSENARIFAGAFTFSSKNLFDRLSKHLFHSNLVVAGEYYLDSLLGIALSWGIPVRTFEPQIGISLGTPHEYETSLYWQSGFDKWSQHPYSLRNDPFGRVLG